MLDPKNVVTITAGLVDVPELVNNDKIAKLRVAMDYAGKDSDNADNRSGYFDVVYYKDDNGSNSKFVFGQISNGNFKKGSQLQIVGRIFQDRWKNEGKTNSRVYIVAEGITYAGSAPKAEGAEGATAAAPAAEAVTLPDKF